MAGKTVVLDDEAYEILNRRKREGQSFSEVVKEQLGEPKRGTAGYLLRNAQKYVLSEETLDAVEEQIRARSLAVQEGALLVTRNVKHYRRIPDLEILTY